MEQKCTIDNLIKILNKITKAFGFGTIENITFLNKGYYLQFRDVNYRD